MTVRSFPLSIFATHVDRQKKAFPNSCNSNVKKLGEGKCLDIASRRKVLMLKIIHPRRTANRLLAQALVQVPGLQTRSDYSPTDNLSRAYFCARDLLTPLPRNGVTPRSNPPAISRVLQWWRNCTDGARRWVLKRKNELANEKMNLPAAVAPRTRERSLAELPAPEHPCDVVSRSPSLQRPMSNDSSQ